MYEFSQLKAWSPGSSNVCIIISNRDGIESGLVYGSITPLCTNYCWKFHFSVTFFFFHFKHVKNPLMTDDRNHHLINGTAFRHLEWFHCIITWHYVMFTWSASTSTNSTYIFLRGMMRWEHTLVIPVSILRVDKSIRFLFVWCCLPVGLNLYEAFWLNSTSTWNLGYQLKIHEARSECTLSCKV